MDLDDLIKNLAPFAFVIVWIASAIFGNAEKIVTKTSSPVFKPPRRPNTGPGGETDTASGNKPFDADPEEPFFGGGSSRKNEPTPQPNPDLKQILDAIQRRQEAQARAEAAAQVEAARVAEEESKPRQNIGELTPEFSSVPQMQLLHLVPDHAAQVHLDPLHEKSLVSTKATADRNALQMQELVQKLKRPEASREAMLMSIVLGEPKCKRSL